MAEHEVGPAIRRARLARGLSLRGLAYRVGVSPATMSAWENGHTSITVPRLQEIARMLDVPASGLLSGEIGATPPPLIGVPSEGEKDWRRYDDLDLGPVLTAAARLFVRLGFHATSMREIAAAAGMSVAGIYHHYSGKERILVALMDLTMSEIRWRLVAARAAGAGPTESFALMVESLALFHAVRGDLAFLGASEMRGMTGSDLVRMTALRNEVQHLLDEQAALAYPGADVRVTCRAIATMCTALPTWFRVTGPLAAPEVARRYARLAHAMMSAPPV